MSAGPDSFYHDRSLAERFAAIPTPRERHESLMRALWDIGTSPFKARFLAGVPEIEHRTANGNTSHPHHEQNGHR